ncbi:hypothetical protein Tco_0724576 [Tanacetum coccineum]
MGIVPTEMELVLEQTQQGISHEVSPELDVILKLFSMKMEILLVSTSNSTAVDSILQAGNPVKEILLNLNLPNHRLILTDSKIYIKMEWRLEKMGRLCDYHPNDMKKEKNEEERENVESDNYLITLIQETPICNIRCFTMFKYSFCKTKSMLLIEIDTMISTITIEDAAARTMKSFDLARKEIDNVGEVSITLDSYVVL